MLKLEKKHRVGVKRKAEKRLVFCQTQALSQPERVDSELPQTLKKGKPENERPTVNIEVLIALRRGDWSPLSSYIWKAYKNQWQLTVW